MACHEVPLPAARGQGPPRLTVGGIARAHGDVFKRQHPLSEAQRKVLRDVSACRTEVLGGRVDVCSACGDARPVFHSCRNRHCPTCQGLRQARWMEGRLARLLPTDYFHVVFTVPDELLAGLALRNREVFFDAMFAAGSGTLLALGEDPKRLGAQLGLTAVLHTWTRDLRFHPHLHCIVTGGGLTRDGAKWKSTRQDYLFPVRVLSRLFRGKLIAALDAAQRSGHLDLSGLDDALPPAKAFGRLKDKLYRTEWVSYAKPPFAGAESVYQYLGRYTHRVGLSNHRLLAATDEAVTFRTRGDDTATLHPHEFLRRFLQHVLPPGFVKLRHYGLLAPSNVNTKLVTARTLLQNPAGPASVKGADAVVPEEPPTGTAEDDKTEGWRELLHRLTGLDVSRCLRCRGALHSHPLPQTSRRPKPKDDTS